MELLFQVSQINVREASQETVYACESVCVSVRMQVGVCLCVCACAVGTFTGNSGI
jgi:hypothetical protein